MAASQMLRLNILDRSTGVCLFERLWNWSTAPSNREGLCNLILTFYMLSRDIGEGDVSHVLFDATRGDKGKSQMGKIGAQTHCRLSFGRSDNLVVALFHDPTLDILIVTQYIAGVLKQFEGRFLSELRGLQPTFADMVNEKVDPGKKAKPDEILSRFAPFEKEADALRDQTRAELKL